MTESNSNAHDFYLRPNGGLQNLTSCWKGER